MNVLAGDSATLDANGAATITVAPPASRQWRVLRVEIQAVRVGSDVQPRAFLYRNANTPANQVDATYQGDRNTSDHGCIVRNGETLSVQWTGGTSGCRVSVTVYGDDATDTIELPAPPLGRGFETPIVSADPQQPGITTKQPITLASAELFDYTDATLTIPAGSPFEYISPIVDVREWNVCDLCFQWQTNTNFTNVSIDWFADSAGARLLGNMAYRTITNRPIRDSFVNLGPFLRVRIGGTAGTYNMGRFFVRGRNGPLISGQGEVVVLNGGDPTQIARRDFGALAAGAVENVDFAFVQRGWATLSWQSDAGGGAIVVVRQLNSAGAFDGDYSALATIVAAGGIVADTNRWNNHIALGPTLHRIQLINVAGAAFNVSVFVRMGPAP